MEETNCSEALGALLARPDFSISFRVISILGVTSWSPEGDLSGLRAVIFQSSASASGK
jgi:hypothetical protein